MPTLRDSIKYYTLENFKPHVIDGRLNLVSMVDAVMSDLKLHHNNRHYAYDIVSSLIPRLRDLGYIEG